MSAAQKELKAKKVNDEKLQHKKDKDDEKIHRGGDVYLLVVATIDIDQFEKKENETTETAFADCVIEEVYEWIKKNTDEDMKCTDPKWRDLQANAVPCSKDNKRLIRVVVKSFSTDKDRTSAEQLLADMQSHLVHDSAWEMIDDVYHQEVFALNFVPEAASDLKKSRSK